MLRLYAVYCYCFYPNIVNQFLSGKYIPHEIMNTIGKDNIALPDSQYFRPEPLDALAVMLVSKLDNVPASFLKLDGDYEKWWGMAIRGIFDNSMRFFDDNSSLKHIETVVEVYRNLSMVPD